MEKDQVVDQELGLVPTQQDGEVVDAVFGTVTEDGPKFRDVGWKGTVVLMMKTQIGLGVLSIPQVFDTLGLIPGLICLLAIAGITTWSDWVIGVFKKNHLEVYSIADAGYIMFGRVGRDVLGTTYCLCWIFVAGSAMLSTSIGFNAVSMHGTCTAIFVAVTAAVGFGLGSLRTLGRISWLAWVGLVSIMVAILTVTIAVGIQDRPASAPQTGEWTSDWKLVGDPTFGSALGAISSLIFSFAGTPAFFSIVSEMRDQKHYNRSLFVCQGAVTITYSTIGIVVYIFCGSFVASPALGSAGVLMKKVCYGLALPGLFVTTVLFIHLAAKYAFVRMLRGSKHLTSNSVTHWCTWIGCTLSVTVVSYVIASGIPVFGGLVSLIGALLNTLQCFQTMGCMWLYDNWTVGKSQRSPKWIFMVCWSVFLIVSGTFLTVAGTWSAVMDIKKSYAESGGSAAWSCADNSNSV